MLLESLKAWVLVPIFDTRRVTRQEARSLLDVVVAELL